MGIQWLSGNSERAIQIQLVVLLCQLGGFTWPHG